MDEMNWASALIGIIVVLLTNNEVSEAIRNDGSAQHCFKVGETNRKEKNASDWKVCANLQSHVFSNFSSVRGRENNNSKK